jgi:hypothetical protein
MRRSYVLTGVTVLAIVAVGLLWLGRGKTGGPCPLQEPAPPEGCESCPVPPGPLPRSNRLLGIDVTIPQEGSYDDAFGVARNAGMDFTTLSLGWDELEPVPGQYADEQLDAANASYHATGTRLALTVTFMDAVRLRVPSDLDGRALDDHEVVSRFKSLLRHVLERLPDVDVFVLSIGNEVDAYLADDELLWQQYTEFFRQTAEHARKLRPGMDIGVKMRFRGLTRDAIEQAQALNEYSDVVLLTYYPLNADFTVRPPWQVDEELGKVAALYPDRVAMLLECGYPSGVGVGSSEELQADFVRQVFAAWDHRALWLRAVCFTWLHDRSPGDIESFSRHYGVDDEQFLEFLATLGLRTFDGRPKAAFDVLRTEVGVRGW